MFERILTTEQLAALGKVVAESARIESMIDVVLRHITKLSVTQYNAFNQGTSMLGRKIDILLTVGLEQLRSDLKRKHLKEILHKLKSLNRDRVIFVHGQWKEAPAKGGTPVSHAEFFGIGKKPSGKGFAVLGKEGKARTLTANRLEATAAGLRTVYDELLTFWTDNWVFPKLRRQLGRKSKAKTSAPA